MGGHAAGDQPEAVGNFFCGLNAAILNFSAGAHHAAALCQAELGIDLGEMFADHERDAELHEPSSPASAKKITSRSSDTFPRWRSSMVMSPAVTLSLSSTMPRP